MARLKQTQGLKTDALVAKLLLDREGDGGKVLGETTSLAGERGVIPISIKTFHDGNLVCVASAQNNTSIEPTVSHSQHLRVIEPVKEAYVVVTSGQTEFFEGKTLDLQCKVKKGTYVTYKWLLDGEEITETHYRYIYNNQLIVYRTTSKDSGLYMCIAQNSYNKTIFQSNSSTVQITIKDVVSTPDISFTVLKEDMNYSALISCHSLSGTPPITFTLWDYDDLIGNVTAEDRNATFKIPIVLGKHLGFRKCKAENGDEIAHSRWMELKVVPVEGPVSLYYDYDTGSNYAVVGVRFYCKPLKGSHVKFEWFLNETLLPHGLGPFYRVVDDPPKQSILLLAVDWSSAGTYHCEVSDTFDNTKTIPSRRKYLDKEVLNRIPDVVVAVVFGSFALLIGLVCTCCGIGIVYRPRTNDVKPRVEMKKMLAAYEEDLGFTEFTEDTEDMKEAMVDEFDQVSVDSVNDWPWLKTRKTNVSEQQEEDQPVLLP
ncbi:Fc receptor-like protein 5 isoform X2 [Boleophthalmus pectinirostris]|uniref:Fc receptor-like protein 5 isoform X2 n=1 Tax=Boleophthalmus pectinirostris TaxID=150288 RepID=UPI0024325473|nr:Fc receptor-like protein 5 isoform X2 [Boleophthalmus pectinirostris]